MAVNARSFFIMAFVLSMALAGCASSVKRPTPNGTAAGAADIPSRVFLSPTNPVSGVSISLSDKVKTKTADDSKFSQDELLARVRRALETNGLLTSVAAGPLPSLEIQITNVRVRGTFSAVMWGFMAGADSIAGDVTLRNASGEPVDTFHVSVSYALGGFAGGQESTRMDWMYEKFAQETLKALTTGETNNKKG
jgi:hypothetical protein